MDPFEIKYTKGVPHQKDNVDEFVKIFRDLPYEEQTRRIVETRKNCNDIKTMIVNEKRIAMDTNIVQSARNVPPIPPYRHVEKCKFAGHAGKVYSMEKSKDEMFLTTTGQDGLVIVWDAQTGDMLDAVAVENTWALCSALNTENSLLAIGGLHNTISIFPIQNEPQQQSQQPQTVQKHKNKRKDRGELLDTPRMVLKGHRGHVSGVGFINESKLISTSGDMSAKLWDVNYGVSLRDFSDHLSPVHGVIFSPTDPHILATAASDKSIKMWDVRIRRNIQSFPVIDCGDIVDFKFHPQGAYITSISEESVVKMFDMRADGEVQEHKIHFLNGPCKMEFSNSGRVLATGFDTGDMLFVDVLKGQIVADLRAHSDHISGIVRTKNAYITSSWDGVIKAWQAIPV